jgi:hypothetical protein
MGGGARGAFCIQDSLHSQNRAAILTMPELTALQHRRGHIQSERRSESSERIDGFKLELVDFLPFRASFLFAMLLTSSRSNWIALS